MSCNDWCLRDEVGSAYLQEALIAAEEAWFPGAGFAPDGAETWVVSDYLSREPSSLAAAASSGWAAPWLPQAQVSPCAWLAELTRVLAACRSRLHLALQPAIGAGTRWPGSMLASVMCIA